MTPFPLQTVLDVRKRREERSLMDFVEEARLTKDDFGGWRVSYAYDPDGPKWRRDDGGTLQGEH